MTNSEARHEVADISLGGVRVFSDDKHAKGEHLELELFLPDGSSISVESQIVWIDPLDKGPAKFEVGLRFLDVADADRAKLEKVLVDVE